MQQLQSVLEGFLWLFENESPYAAFTFGSFFLAIAWWAVALFWICMSFRKDPLTRMIRRHRARNWASAGIGWFIAAGFIWSPRQCFTLNHNIGFSGHTTEACTGVTWRLPINIPILVNRQCYVVAGNGKRYSLWINNPEDFFKVVRQFQSQTFGSKDIAKATQLLLDVTQVEPGTSAKELEKKLRNNFELAGGQSHTISLAEM